MLLCLVLVYCIYITEDILIYGFNTFCLFFLQLCMWVVLGLDFLYASKVPEFKPRPCTYKAYALWLSYILNDSLWTFWIKLTGIWGRMFVLSDAPGSYRELLPTLLQSLPIVLREPCGARYQTQTSHKACT